MATINDVKVFLQMLWNKNQSGNSLTSDQFNKAALFATEQVYEKYYRQYLKTNVVNDFLYNFIASTSLTQLNGQVTIPSDYEHTVDMKTYYIDSNNVAKWVPVKEVSTSEWSKIESSQLLIPTLRYPKFATFPTKFEFLPRNIGLIRLDYFKTPTPPIWAFTIVNNREVYDSTNSVQFQFSELYYNEVMAVMCQFIGINLREGELENFGQQYQIQQER